jgi:prepilin-type N-terminal cleavage/methylation domain-containing protein
MRPAGAARRDGFTLIEMVTAVTVLALVLAPLVSAAVFYIQHAQVVGAYFADDGTVRAATALFVTDGQSAETVTAPDPSPCGAPDPALGTITWDDAGTVFRASWFATTSGSVTTLIRRRCTGTSLVSSVVLGDIGPGAAMRCTPDCAAPTTLELSGTTQFGSAFTITARRRST